MPAVPTSRPAMWHALRMISFWLGSKIQQQLKAVAFVVLYLLVVQWLILKVPIEQALSIGLGIGATVLGLALFLEGLFLGIMPLGERCGLKLPGRARLPVIMAFALVLGLTATLAEPAIGFLKLQGSSLRAWDSPILYYLLNSGANWLVMAVAGGVGLAVVLGVLRFMYGWPFKPFVLIIVPVLLLVSVYFNSRPDLSSVLGLAWDTGGVTTGPVTVPLVIALGLGIARIVGKGRDSSGSLGVVTLASALPVLTVAILALALAPRLPVATTPLEFFSQGQRQASLFAAGGPSGLRGLAAEAWLAGELSASHYQELVEDLGGDTASEPNPAAQPEASVPGAAIGADSGLVAALWASLLAVLPLALVLIFTLMVILRDRIPAVDEVSLGLVLAVAGMFLFSIGMQKGLSDLGSQVGRAVPRAYQTTSRPDQEVHLNLAADAVFTVHTTQGPRQYFWLLDEAGSQPVAIAFEPGQYDPTSGSYRHVPVQSPVFAAWGAWSGYLAALLFVFVLGFGATLAEPSLRALGVKLEEATTGTYKSSTLVRTVALGVGLGMLFGFGRILLDLPLAWILLGAYGLALVLTLASTQEFAAIAWDSAGVTTGPITVPLVIATGLGLGAEAGAGSAFGVVACASVFPILAVLISGIANRAAARRALNNATLPNARLASGGGRGDV